MGDMAMGFQMLMAQLVIVSAAVSESENWALTPMYAGRAGFASMQVQAAGMTVEL